MNIGRMSTSAFRAAVTMALAGSLLASCSQESASTGEDTGSVSAAVTAVPGRYIVVLKDAAVQASGKSVTAIGADIRAAYGGSIVLTYEHALRGYAMDLSASELAALSGDSRVAYIEPDAVGSIVATQTGATWGIDRIDQRNLPLSTTYTYPDQGGAGVHAYILDTGIDATHPEFGTRVGAGFDFVDNDASPDDCHGHGTHVAGTIGSATWGVAKQVTVHSVRVCDCGGFCPSSRVIAGIDWVTANHIGPSVANISLHNGFVQAENDAVTNSIAAGVTYGIAAANDNLDACNDSPGSTPNALTVGATDTSDTRASFSNWGPCLDLFAPGVNIHSTWLAGSDADNSGTSMAAPHVVGAAALYLGLNPTATPAQVGAQLTSQATPGLVVDPGTGSPNLLLYTGFMNGSSNAAPVVNAGPDQTITLPAAANLNGSATDDGLPNPPGALTRSWTKVSGPGTVTFANASNPVTTATFSAAGVYVLRLTANDSALIGADDVQITVNPAAPATPCSGLCSNPKQFSWTGSYQSGNIGTGAVCLETTQVVHGGNCGNFVSPRTLSVNGQLRPCTYTNWATIPPARNGGYCIQTTAGNHPWAFITTW
jgi:subtilisin family serine protease